MTIEFSNFSFRYESLDKPTLKNINLRIEKGEKIVIIGPSGSGKSTLGQCLNGLIPHAIKGETSGQLTINFSNGASLGVDLKEIKDSRVLNFGNSTVRIRTSNGGLSLDVDGIELYIPTQIAS